MKPKHQRLSLAIIALAALIGAGLLAASALREEASYFYTPMTLAKAKVAPGQAIRLGGMVQNGSIKRAADGVTVHFIVQDRDATQKVSYRGITPDLFTEGSGVVADGRLSADGTFVALGSSSSPRRVGPAGPRATSPGFAFPTTDSAAGGAGASRLANCLVTGEARKLSRMSG